MHETTQADTKTGTVEQRDATFLELNKRLRRVWVAAYGAAVQGELSRYRADGEKLEPCNATLADWAEDHAWEAVLRANGGDRPRVGVAEVAAVKRGMWSGDTMLTVAGKPFRCECGANVFKRRTDDPSRIRCNGCGAMWKGES